MTVQDLIKRALRIIGAISSGDPLDATEGADALVALNSMLSSWSVDRLSVYTITAATYALTSSQQNYTIGAGGNFNAARPARIETANIILTANGNLRRPLRIWSDAQWSDIRLQAVGGIPNGLYYDAAYPLGTIALFPYPNVAASIELYTWSALTRFAALTDTISLPDGYEEALTYNLALRLAPEFGAAVAPVTAALASESKERISLLNLPPAPVIECDSGLGGSTNRGGLFNWLTGDCG